MRARSGASPAPGMISNLLGAHSRLFAEPQPTADERAFQLDNTSARYSQSPYYLLHRRELQPVPAPNMAPPRLDLTDVLPDAVLQPIVAANKIVFHSVGDTGAAKVNRSQTAATAIAHEAGVADSMANDVATGGPDGPAFFFHLGDVVYNFGEGQYYYDQFYEPFRNYDRPIFAIPGNHDGSVFGDRADLPQVPTLTAFLRNFCALTPARSPDAGALVRSTMTQPGVYFTLEAPFVSIIGLYTNVLEGPGVISSEIRGGHDARLPPSTRPPRKHSRPLEGRGESLARGLRPARAAAGVSGFAEFDFRSGNNRARVMRDVLHTLACYL
jgi:calcineurin-like phosphoesterase family protein